MKNLKRPSAGDPPPELLDMVRALSREAPDAAVIARAERALESLPQPTAAPSKLGPTALAGIGSAVVIVAIGLFALRSPTPRPTPPATVAPSPAQPPPPASPKPPEPPQPSAAAPLSPVRVPVPVPVRDLPSPTDPPPPQALKPTRLKSLAPALPSTPTAITPSPPPSAAAAERRATPAATPPASTTHPKPPEPVDEAGLLFRAKRLAPRDPEAALRLLDTHAFYFPSGAFVQEREILAIQLLERVGRTEQAQERVAKFRARFPKSVYRSSDPP